MSFFIFCYGVCTSNFCTEKDTACYTGSDYIRCNFAVLFVISYFGGGGHDFDCLGKWRLTGCIVNLFYIMVM